MTNTKSFCRSDRWSDSGLWWTDGYHRIYPVLIQIFFFFFNQIIICLVKYWQMNWLSGAIIRNKKLCSLFYMQWLVYSVIYCQCRLQVNLNQINAQCIFSSLKKTNPIEFDFRIIIRIKKKMSKKNCLIRSSAKR